MKRVLSPLSAYLPLLLLLVASPATAEDWPTWRHDSLRTGVTGESLALPLEEAWQFRSRQSTVAPKFEQPPDWINYPNDMHYTLPMIAVGECIYFTSADEGRVACMDAATAEIRWEFIAGGGVNRTPCYSEGKLYFGSNEGIVYCLQADTGEVVWQFDARPTGRMLIAYGQMVSVWPVMTDVQVDDGVAYFATGIFPHDGTFVYAVDAENGEVLWRSAHSAENGGRDSLAPGGHLFVTPLQVWVPKDYLGFAGIGYGAGTPFSRDRGRFTGGWGDPNDEVYQGRPETFWPYSGVAVEGVRYLGNKAVEAEGERTEIWSHEIEGRFSDYDSVLGVRMGGKYGLPVVMRYDPDMSNIIYAGGTIFHTAYDIDPAAGQTGIYARDPANGEVLWQVEVPEPVNQLIVANGRLLAGTRYGTIYCFLPQGSEKLGTIEESIAEQPIEVAPEIATAAEAIVQATDLENGYALVLDCQDAQLPYELARRTNLYVCATFSDEQALAAARQVFVQAGMHNSRIVARLVAPGERLPFPSYFADVVVSAAAIRGGALPTDIAEVERMTKPIRGIVLLSANAADDLAEYTAASGLAGWETVEYAGSWAKWVRPELPEAGAWTHMYGDPGQHRPAVDDGALKPPLGMALVRPAVHSATAPIKCLAHRQRHSSQPRCQLAGRLRPVHGPQALAARGRRHWRGSRSSWRPANTHIYVIWDKVIIQINLETGEELGGFMHALWRGTRLELDGRRRPMAKPFTARAPAVFGPPKWKAARVKSAGKLAGPMPKSKSAA